jgi:hypothetical protein
MLNYFILLATFFFSLAASFSAQAQAVNQGNQVSQQKAQTTNTAIGNNNATAVSVTEQNNQQRFESSNQGTLRTPQHSIYIQVGQSLSNRSTATTASPSHRTQSPNSQSGVRNQQFLIQKMAIESKERIAEQQIESQAKLSVFNRLVPDW